MSNFPKVNEIYEGVVVKVYPNYAILLLENGYSGLLHISEVSDTFIRTFSSYVTVGNIYTVKIIEANEETQNIKVSKRKLTPEETQNNSSKKIINPESVDFTKLAENLPEWIKKQVENED